ncbi:hypothetical protein [Companilactobacillus kedongensis]|uniref:hypothetical protein n=1 Tax=Companilactobacillus kedongensis TaxID=2486004 RepID=UPI000F799329|nr:hypothetical protein [Companilactobacillus kedongensis]
MNRFDHEYEIRIDSKYSHLRILFFTLPEIADSLFSEGIVLSFVIEKYGSSLNMNNVIDRLCEDAESVREIIYMDNYEEWLEEL